MRSRIAWYLAILLLGITLRFAADFFLTRHERAIASLLWRETARQAGADDTTEELLLYDGVLTPGKRPAPSA